MRDRARFHWLHLAAMLLAVPVWADPPAGPETQTAAGRRTTAAAGGSARRQGASGGFQDRTFPRDRSHFATDRNLELDDAEVVALLGRTLHREPAIDAYMKWQLMSFEPDLGAIDQPAVAAILANLPRLQRLPGPAADANAQAADWLEQREAQRAAAVAVGGNRQTVAAPRFDPTLSVAQQGAVLDVQSTVTPDRRYVTATIRADSVPKLNFRQRAVSLASNRVAGQARDAVVAGLAADDVRVVAMFVDLRDRVSAGDRSVPAVAARLAVAVEAMNSPGAAPVVSLRQRLADWAEAIGRMATPVYETESIPGTFAEQTQVRWVRVDPGWVMQIQSLLAAPGAERFPDRRASRRTPAGQDD